MKNHGPKKSGSHRISGNCFVTYRVRVFRSFYRVVDSIAKLTEVSDCKMMKGRAGDFSRPEGLIRMVDAALDVVVGGGGGGGDAIPVAVG